MISLPFTSSDTSDPFDCISHGYRHGTQQHAYSDQGTLQAKAESETCRNILLPISIYTRFVKSFHASQRDILCRLLDYIWEQTTTTITTSATAPATESRDITNHHHRVDMRLSNDR